jgi:hypothetical protein
MIEKLNNNLDEILTDPGSEAENDEQYGYRRKCRRKEKIKKANETKLKSSANRDSPKEKSTVHSPNKSFEILKTSSFPTPILRQPQVFMFDGVRKRKVILRKIKPHTDRLKEF